MMTLEKFEEASELVKKVTNPTKLIYSEYLSAQTGAKVYLKPENMQHTGAYKIRGAYYKISTLTDEERSRGLITGVSTLAKMLNPKIKVIGVEPSEAASMTAALKAGEPVKLPSANTIADGTAVKEVGDKVVPYVKENVDDILLVDDDELIGAFLDMVENHKMIVENSGLLSVAALKQMDIKGKKVVCVLSGGNMDVITMSSIVQHGLIQRDRIFSVSVLLPDKPGELARVAQTVADVQGNIIKLEHNQFVSTNRNAAVELRITMEAFGTDHKKKILDTLDKAGFRPKLISAKLY